MNLLTEISWLLVALVVIALADLGLGIARFLHARRPTPPHGPIR